MEYMLLEASNVRIRLLGFIYIMVVHEECFYAMTKCQTLLEINFIGEKFIILSPGLMRALFIFLQSKVAMGNQTHREISCKTLEDRWEKRIKDFLNYFDF